MKRGIPAVFFLCLIFVSLPAEDGIAEEGEVEEALELVLAELEPRWSAEWLPEWDLRDLLEFIQRLGELRGVYRLLFYLALGALLFYIVNKILLAFMPDRAVFSGGKPEGKDGRAGDIRRRAYLTDALQLSREGAFSPAVILLHLGSVQFLRDRRFLETGRDYTNREVLRILKNQDLRDPFGFLAREAEMIRFKGSAANEALFRRLENLYRENFHEEA